MSWLLYGATGYTGDLIAREAVRRGMRPILAGRNEEAVKKLANELGLEHRAFDLDHIDLRGVELVLHCAGPFSRTSRPMVDACLTAGAHYLDITGEYEVYESIFARDAEAKQRGVTLLPGVGFDVVPTDCLAAMLAERMPDANELWLAFYSHRGGISPGTLKTAIEGAAKGGAIRRDGKLVRVPTLFDVRTIPFSIGEKLSVTIPWGDLATAYRTTGIPNIRVYTARSPKALVQARRASLLMRLPFAVSIAQKLASKHSGPSAEQRTNARMYLWGRVARAAPPATAADEVTMTMDVPEGYTFTVLASLAAVDRVLQSTKPGAWTPASLLGSRFVRELDGVTAPVESSRRVP